MSERGSSFGCERIEIMDDVTGAFILQLTAAQTFSTNYYFEHNSFLCDDRTLVFNSQRYPGRGAPLDMFRVDEDGRNLTQLTDEKHPLGYFSFPAWKSRLIYGTRENRLICLNPDTFEEDEILCFEEGTGFGACTITSDDRYFIGITTLKDGTRVIVRMSTDGSEAVTMCHGLPVNHVVANPARPEFTFNGEGQGHRGAFVCDVETGEARPFPFDQFAHCAWMGRKGPMQGTLLPPGHGISMIASDEEEAALIVTGGPYFWHSASTLDGEWIVADTNWPDVGIQLINVATRRYGCLCKSLGSNADWVHPHPAFNREGTKVVFASDRTGIPQVYLVTIPDHLRNEISGGQLTHRQRWVGRVI